MSVSSLVIVCSLVAQIAGGNRYGAPPGTAASPFSDPPAATTPPAERTKVSPPPKFSTNEVAEDTTPIADEPPTYRTPAAQSNPPVDNRSATSSPTRPATQAANPSAMMASLLTAPPGSRLAGRPIALADVVAGAGSREAQSERIETYWDLCSAVADYYLGVREQDELQRLRSSNTGSGPAWQQAAAELGVRLATSQRAAVTSQYRLASLMGGIPGSDLPLPADLPHCGDYYARYDQVFAGRQSPEAQQLSELLPMRYEELCDASLAVTRAEQFLNAVAAQRGGDGTGTLRALELLALRRRAFVQIARDYNRRIERYTELASPGQIDTERLIGMLIRREDRTNTATRPANLVPPPNRQSQLPIDEFVDPNVQTYAEGWESIKSASAETPIDEAVKPASAESRRSKPRREHSLLVPSG